MNEQGGAKNCTNRKKGIFRIASHRVSVGSAIFACAVFSSRPLSNLYSYYVVVIVTHSPSVKTPGSNG